MGIRILNTTINTTKSTIKSICCASSADQSTDKSTDIQSSLVALNHNNKKLWYTNANDEAVLLLGELGEDSYRARKSEREEEIQRYVRTHAAV